MECGWTRLKYEPFCASLGDLRGLTRRELQVPGFIIDGQTADGAA
jgi:hypothetical protein